MTTTPMPPSLIATLPGHYHTDPDLFRQEQEHIFESMWFCAVRSADLDKPGAFRTVQVGRENVLITRTRKGGLRAFLNVCVIVERDCAWRTQARSGATSSVHIMLGRTILTAH